MKSIIAWFARNHVAANLLMAMTVVAGLVALPTIQQKSFPDIDIEAIQVTVVYLGAAPEEVEDGVCMRIEEVLQGIDGIEKMVAIAAEGACNVTAELISGYDVDRALSEIKNAVDGIDTFPVDTEKPIVNHFEIRRRALQLALSGDASERTLKQIGQRLRDEISALPGITQVELGNVRADEISIEVSEETLRRHRLGFDQVVDAVRRSSLDLPGGSIKASEGEILLRTKGQARTGREFEEIVVLTRPNGTRLTLGEIATVRDGFEEDDRFARFDGESAVLITVYRVGDQKVLDLVATVQEYVADAEGTLPAGVDLTVWSDGSRSLRDRLDILVRNGRSGFILVFVLLSCFLRLRLAIWVSLGVPLAFLGALALFTTLGISIDVISLFAFILVLGLLVDDAIVVGENVHTHQEHGEDPLESAITGTQEVSVPVIFGVLTTIAAFLPLLLAPGAMGQIFSGIGVVVVLCLFFSVIESQLVLPCHLGHSRERQGPLPPPPTTGVRAVWKRFQGAMSGSLVRIADRGYRPYLERVLEWRYATIATGLVLLMLTLGTMASGWIKFSFFPPVESDYVSATLTMPQGTPVAETTRAVRELEAAARRVKAILDQRFPPDPEAGRGSLVRHVMASVGSQPSTGEGHGRSNGGGSGSHLGEVSLELQSGDARPIPAKEVVAIWRAESPPVPGAESLVFDASLFSAGDPINLQLTSPDVDQLVLAAEQLKDQLRQYPGVFDVRDSFSEGKKELRLAILPAAETLGLTLEDLARQVRYAFYGAEAQRIQRDREDVRVMVRYPERSRRSLGDLETMRIRTPAGNEVPFSTVAKVEAGRGYATIRRTDRQRVVNVSADVDLALANANEVMASLRKDFLPRLLSDHPGLSFELEGEQREQQKLIGSMVRTMTLSLMAIYTLLAIPLRSYSQPLIIMSVIPFGLVGAIGGHLLLGEGLSMMSIMGVLALSGVVVNSSLVMVHYVNTRRAAGRTVEQAVRDAGVARFRPIVLTSLTTFAGLTPLLMERSVSAQFLVPMAISLGFGVAFATTITLFLVPCFYLVLEDLRRITGRMLSDGEDEPAAPELIKLPDPPRSGSIRNAGGGHIR